MSRINAKRFSAIMRELARVPSRAAKPAAAAISREIQRNMDAGKDPYGKAWKLKANGQRSQLLKTGRGRASIRVLATAGAGFKITVGVLYMIYHQFGGKSHLRGHKKHPDFGRDKDRGGRRNNPPKRSFLPFDKLPPAWGEIILAEIEKAASKVIRHG